MNVSSYTTPFWIKNVSGSSGTISLRRTSSRAPQLDVQYSSSKNFSSYNTITTSTARRYITVNNNDTIYLRCETTSWANATTSFNFNEMQIQFDSNVGGNIMSLLYGSNFTGYEKTFPTSTYNATFNGLFQNSYIVDASELVLPVTHIVDTVWGQYRAMFIGCSRMIYGPHIDLRLNSSVTYDRPLAQIFSGCTSLTSIHINTEYSSDAFNQFLQGFSPTNQCTIYNYSGSDYTAVVKTNVVIKNVTSMYFDYDRVVDWSIAVDNIAKEVIQITDNQNEIIWNKQVIPYPGEPFYVQDVSGLSNEISIKKKDSNAPTLTIQKSIDNLTWETVGTTSTNDLIITLPANTKVYLRCSTDTWGVPGTNNSNTFVSTTNTQAFRIGGNIMSLLYGSIFIGNETAFPNTTGNNFTRLFELNTHLVDASRLMLPALTLNELCYAVMFDACTSLKFAPTIIPATTLAEYCCMMMFGRCSSLITTPELPATTLVRNCYSDMFYDCTSLTTSPILPAQTLARECYYAMFDGCTSLNNVTCFATTNIDYLDTTYNWLHNVASSGTFTKAAGVTWPRTANGIPSGWTVVEQ